MKQTRNKGVYLKLNEINDKDVIERLDSKQNKQGYIKELIRDDIVMDVFRNGVQNGTIKIEQGQ